MLGEPLVDWLNLYGEQNGHTRDRDRPDYLPEVQLGPFVMQKGVEFEKCVYGLIAQQTTITNIERASSNFDCAYEATRAAMAARAPAIYQGLLRDEDRLLFGIPDFLMLGSEIKRHLSLWYECLGSVGVTEDSRRQWTGNRVTMTLPVGLPNLP